MEIGYGLNPAVWNRGCATEGVGALVAALLVRSDVRRVTAQTAVTIPASGRVLEKLGFQRVGTAWDREDGDLILWARGAGAKKTAPARSGGGRGGESFSGCAGRWRRAASRPPGSRRG